MIPSSSAGPQQLPTRIVIADDHPVFVDGLYTGLRKHKNIRIMGHAFDGRELLQLVERMQPDVVLTDIQMPVMDGVAATREIRLRYPGIQVIALSGFDEEAFITDMLDAGASGYLLKNAHPTEIVTAIEKAMRNEMYYSLGISNRVMALLRRTQNNPLKPVNKPRFSDRELAVIKEICNGLSSKEIAEVLCIDVRAVEGAKERIMEKTGCNNSTSIAMYAVRNYIVQL